MIIVNLKDILGIIMFICIVLAILIWYIYMTIKEKIQNRKGKK